jgi:hypothetical protein
VSPRTARWVLLLLVAVLGPSACSDGSDSSSSPTAAPGTVPGPPLPAACQLVAAAEVQSALGVPVSAQSGGGADRCRYVSERRDEVEITVDHPGFNDAVRAYRGLNPEAEQVEGIGDEAAVRVGDGVGELIFVKGSARFFVVVSGPSSTRDALLSLAGTAAQRL